MNVPGKEKKRQRNPTSLPPSSVRVKQITSQSLLLSKRPAPIFVESCFHILHHSAFGQAESFHFGELLQLMIHSYSEVSATSSHKIYVILTCVRSASERAEEVRIFIVIAKRVS